MPENEEAESWSGAVEAAWDKLEQPAAEPVAVAEPAPVAEAAPTEPDSRSRDEKGRFAPAKPAEASKGTPAPRASESGVQDGAVQGAPGGPPAAVAAPAAPPALVSELKAPQSWTPEERDAFAKAPVAAQKAALRREAEITRALQDTAEPRKLREAVAPYEHLFRAAGVSTPQAVGNVIQTYAALHTAPHPVKAQILAKLIRDTMGANEASITLLAQALDTAPPQPQQFSPEAVDRIVEQRIQQREDAAKEKHALGVVGQFEDTQPEHYEKVRRQMGGLLDMWERDNPNAYATVDVLKEAYNQACLLNKEVREIEDRKKEAQAAATTNAATQRARASAVSVKSTPAGPAGPAPLGDDTRSHVAAAWEAAERRQ